MTTKKFDAIVEKAGKVDANYAAQIEGYCSLLGEYGKKFEAVCAMLQPEKLRLSPDKYRLSECQGYPRAGTVGL